MDISTRFKHATEVADYYSEFKDFVIDGMSFLGFNTTPMQEDIAEYMQNGPRLRMVMAQRGEAKTTLAALYATWRLVQRPSTRVLLVSAGAQNSSETATLILRFIMQWDVLEYIRPDRNSGDRVSTEAFDVHFSLKGIDKSPSVAALGITSNLPGKRADLLIPDDIESNTNGLTATQRAQLLHASKEFSSICTHGDILYLGTPQSKDSIYNTLPGRGFEIRIWPGRYPSITRDDKGNVLDESEVYGDKLAPYVRERMQANPDLRTGGGLDGNSGKPTDPFRYTEEDLIEKEIDKGPEDFQLQYMLNTSLVDAMRQQLKLSDLVVANFGCDVLPEIIGWQKTVSSEVPLGPEFPVSLAKMYYAAPVQCKFVAPTDVFMFVDPAGGGADEIAFGVSTTVGPYIHVLDVGGLKGGLTDSNGDELCDVIRRNGVTRIRCESNMGHGVFEIALRSILAANSLQHIPVVGEYSTGQKERRIIDSVVSAMQRHRVVVHSRVFESDRKYNLQHAAVDRSKYSLWFQLSDITTDRNSLVHDDRVEAFAGAVREFKNVLVQDEHKAAAARAKAEHHEYLRNPMGYSDFGKTRASAGTRLALDKGRGMRH